VTSRRRNLGILGLVLVLLALALVVIATKPTKLGLDLEGGTELVYEARPTPQVPQVTPQAVDDALNTIRKRTDALGVSEPEIQRAGATQISIGLPAVQNAERAIEQVGTTAQLQFYDWEPNVLGPRGPNRPFIGSTALYEAVTLASKSKPRAEKTDVPSGSNLTPAQADKANDSAKDRYFLFGPDRRPIGPDGKPVITGDYQPSGSCKEVLSDFDTGSGKPRTYAKGTECEDELAALKNGGPPAGSKVVKVPQGIVVVQAEPAPKQPATVRNYYVLEDDSELSGSDIKNPEANTDPNTQEPIVTMEFTDRGRKAFATVTKRIADRGSKIIAPGVSNEQKFQRFAITLDNKIVSLATIDFLQNPEGIDGRTGAQINGIGDFSAANDLAESLRIGALPVDLKLISQTQVSATLGKQALHQGLIAGIVGFCLTILFLIIFYRVLGLVAMTALVTYAIFLFALVKLIPITLTLPGIAGLILTLGVAADANIVMYERIKEEVRLGKSIPAAISGGYSKALRTIIDANVVTIGVAFILFTLATAGVRGFAFMLGIGTIVSLFTAVLATSAILGTMARSRLLARPSALGVGRQQKARWKFDFMGNSKWFFSTSGAIIATGAIAIATLGINFGIDFESGTRITTPLERPASVQAVRDTLSPLGYADAKIQQVNDPELGSNVVQIAVKQLEPGEVNKVEAALDKDFGVRSDQFSTNSIGPTFGAQIARTAVIAVIASLILISIYIAVRFEWKFAVPVLIALLHDLLITAGVYALTDREVTSATVAALLTILGYSLYDTIIVFDRIRENVPRMPRATYSQIANRSMSEVFTRSLATSASTLMPITALLLFGGETLKDFAFALLVGVASGAYSSIFIATPVLVEWKERERIYMRRRRLVMEQHDGLVPAFATAGPSLGDETIAADAPVRGLRGGRRKRREVARAGRGGGGAGTGVRGTSRTAVQPPPTAPPPITGNGEARGATLPPEPPDLPEPPEAPEPPDAPAAPDGDAPSAGADERPLPESQPSRVTSTSGSESPKEKRAAAKRSRARKKHGRR
jgi:SecD/SecF fusion protein